jgi:hypothetical protein
MRVIVDIGCRVILYIGGTFFFGRILFRFLLLGFPSVNAVDFHVHCICNVPYVE